MAGVSDAGFSVALSSAGFRRKRLKNDFFSGIGETRRSTPSRLCFPTKMRMHMVHIGALGAARLVREPGLDVRKPNLIRPSIRADRFPTAAPEVRAIDKETANASGSHLGEGDLLQVGEGGHAAIQARSSRLCNRPRSWARNARHSMFGHLLTPAANWLGRVRVARTWLGPKEIAAVPNARKCPGVMTVRTSQVDDGRGTIFKFAMSLCAKEIFLRVAAIGSQSRFTGRS